MPTPEANGPEARHERANRLYVLEAICIARRDGESAQQRVRIYEREVARLMAEQPAPTAPGVPCSA